MNVPTESFEASTFPEALGRSGALPVPGVVSEEERTLLGIRQARDLVLAKNRELIEKLAHAEDQIAELTYERDDFRTACDAARKIADDLAAEVDRLHAEIAHLTERQSALSEAEQIYIMARAEIEADLLTAVEERDEAIAGRRSDLLEIERLRTAVEAAKTATTQTEPFADQLAEARRHLAAVGEEQEREAAQHKKLVASLAEQLSTAQRTNHDAQRQIERLEVERDAAVSRASKEKAALEARLTALEATLASATARPAPDAPAARIIPLPVPAPQPLTDQEVRDTISLLFQQFEEVKAQPENPEALDEFEAALRSLAGRTQGSDLALIHHFVATASEFASRLRSTRSKLPAAIPTFEAALEMLGWLGLRGRSAMLEASGALVYAVDDDVDNCECLATAFEKVELQTKYSVRPEVALQQIAAHPCELIILDVDLPGMDGFELRARIRQMPAHSLTPIIFLSGHLSTVERLEALGESSNEFVAKPYNLSELSLRVLTLIVEARLG